jgi:hypothetical protein
VSRQHLYNVTEVEPSDVDVRLRAPETTTRVLYIAGWGRSGSTLVEGMLDQVRGFVGVGEVKFLWERGLIENRRCSCGTPIRACEFWTSVLRRAYGRTPATETVLALDSASNRFRTRHLPRLLARPYATPGDLTEYYAALGRLYRAMREESGAQVVVDSSKFPSYLVALLNTPGLDVRVAHIVRDPRAVAYSWQRHKPDPDAPGDAMMPRLNPGATALYWSAWNLATERLVRRAGVPYLRFRYEDLVTDPAATLTVIADLAGVQTDELPLLDDETTVLAPTHQVSGNPVRFRTGATTLRLDDEWKLGLSPGARHLTGTLTAPLRRRYGYR